MPDGASAFVGISFQLIANTLMGLARTDTQVYVIAIVQGVEAISWAAGRSLMSKLVTKEDQGALFSVVASIQSCVSLLSSVLWPLFYPLTLQNENLPTGFVFFIMAMVDLLAYPLLIFLIISQVLQRRKGSRAKSDFKESDKLLSGKKLPGYSTISAGIQANRNASEVYTTARGRDSINFS